MTNKIELEITLVEDTKQGGYTGWFTDFPQIINEGETIDEVKLNLHKTLKIYVGLINEG